jgi:hypothetical protein
LQWSRTWLTHDNSPGADADTDDWAAAMAEQERGAEAANSRP